MACSEELAAAQPQGAKRLALRTLTPFSTASVKTMD